MAARVTRRDPVPENGSRQERRGEPGSARTGQEEAGGGRADSPSWSRWRPNNRRGRKGGRTPGCLAAAGGMTGRSRVLYRRGRCAARGPVRGLRISLQFTDNEEGEEILEVRRMPPEPRTG